VDGFCQESRKSIFAVALELFNKNMKNIFYPSL